MAFYEQMLWIFAFISIHFRRIWKCIRFLIAACYWFAVAFYSFSVRSRPHSWFNDIFKCLHVRDRCSSHGCILTLFVHVCVCLFVSTNIWHWNRFIIWPYIFRFSFVRFSAFAKATPSIACILCTSLCAVISQIFLDNSSTHTILWQKILRWILTEKIV